MEGKYGTIDLNGELVVPCTYQLEEAMTTVPVSNKDYRQAVKDVKAKLDSGVYSVLTQRLDSIGAKVDSKEVEFSKGLIAPDDQRFLNKRDLSMALGFQKKTAFGYSNQNTLVLNR